MEPHAHLDRPRQRHAAHRAVEQRARGGRAAAGGRGVRHGRPVCREDRPQSGERHSQHVQHRHRGGGGQRGSRAPCEGTR